MMMIDSKREFEVMRLAGELCILWPRSDTISRERHLCPAIASRTFYMSSRVALSSEGQ